MRHTIRIREQAILELNEQEMAYYPEFNNHRSKPSWRFPIEKIDAIRISAGLNAFYDAIFWPWKDTLVLELTDTDDESIRINLGEITPTERKKLRKLIQAHHALRMN